MKLYYFILMLVVCALTWRPDPGFSKTTIFLEGLYATSVQFPHNKYGPEKLFDGNEQTKWSTMPGAGPDEGFMLIFEKPVYIKKMELLPAITDSSIEKIEYVLYVNGFEKPVHTIVSSKFGTAERSAIYANVKTLYFRINDIYIKNKKKENTGITYTSNKPVAFSELRLIGKDNALIDVLPPAIVTGKIKAGSSLAPVESYNPDFLFDSRKDFGWADGNTGKNGNGEYFVFTLGKKRSIKKIKIWNGYQRSRSHFKANERVRSFRFGLSEKSSELYTLPDSSRPQVVTLKAPLNGRSFILKVTGTYPGSAYKDLCISEMRFFDGKKWFIIDSGGVEKRKKQLLSRTGNSLFQTLIDKRVVLKLNRGRVSQSLVLRSNGSFVLWKKEVSSSSTKTVYADGNWQIKGDNTIRVFGRLHRIETFGTGQGFDPYAGGSENNDDAPKDVDSIKIFSDIITVTDKTINSQKGLFKTFKY